MNLGIALVKSEVNILVSYSIITSNNLERSLSEKRVTHGEVIYSKTRGWFMCFTLVAPREMLDGTVDSRR